MESLKLFNGFVAEVHKHTGVTVEPSKRSMLSSRIGRRVRALGLDGPEDYLALLQGLDAAAEELRNFIDVVTTHKTSFFRTTGVWDWLQASLGNETDRWKTFDAWSCACSNGQEPYSLGIVAQEAAKARPGLRWSVAATDVSQMTVDRAKKGEYSASDVDALEKLRPGLHPGAYFGKEKDGLRTVVSSLKSKIRFKQHNLLEPRNESYDIAFLRNVLIYFTESDKEKVVQNVLATLRPGGVLVIGESESLLQRGDGLEYVAPCIYQTTS